MDSKVLYFLGGVVVGSAATFLLLRNKVNREIDDRVNDILEKEREAASKNKEKVDDLKERSARIAKENNQRKADLITSSNISSENGYNSGAVSYNLFSKPPKAKDIHNGIDEGEDLEVKNEGTKPYTITPDEFVGEKLSYDKITLEYYEDGILCNALSEEIIEDINRAIGLESLNKFGEYEEDVVYVRNERISTDYEVIQQHRPFAILPEDDE